MGKAVTDLVGSDVLELVNAASEEAGFLADVRRLLKVRPDNLILPFKLTCETTVFSSFLSFF